jgi:hypothetical protein
MLRANLPEGLRKHGFTLETVKEWRAQQHEAGRPSGLDDFFRAHGMCHQCAGEGRLVTGVRWRDEEGLERKEAGPVSLLIQHHNLLNMQRVFGYWITNETSSAEADRT